MPPEEQMMPEEDSNSTSSAMNWNCPPLRKSAQQNAFKATVSRGRAACVPATLKRPYPSPVAALLAENVVFNSPILARSIQGREAIAGIFAQSSSTRGSGAYTAEHKLDARTTFMRWEGTMDRHKIESLGGIVDNDEGLIVERTIALRP